MKAKDYRKILHDLTAIVDEGVHVVDAKGKSIIYNEAMASLEKTNREDVLGKPFQEAFSHIPPEESSLYRALNENKATINQHQTYRNKYGKEITAVNSTIPVEVDGQVIAAIEIGKDITEIKSMSDTILKLQKESINPKEPQRPKIKRYSFKNLIGENRAFKEVVERAQKQPKPMRQFLFMEKPEPGKNCLPRASILPVKEVINRSWHRTALRSRKAFWKGFYSVRNEAALQVLWTGPDYLNKQAAALCCWMKSVPCLMSCRANCCGCCKKITSGG